MAGVAPDFGLARHFLKQAEDAHVIGDTAGYSAAVKLVNLALGLEDQGHPVRLGKRK